MNSDQATADPPIPQGHRAAAQALRREADQVLGVARVEEIIGRQRIETMYRSAS